MIAGIRFLRAAVPCLAALLVMAPLAAQQPAPAAPPAKAPEAAKPAGEPVKPAATSEDDAFFALPSPNEILVESEKRGMKIAVGKKDMQVVGVDLEKLAQEDPARACFAMGRIFAVAGYRFKDLSNASLLAIAQKIYGGTKGLDLPESIRAELTRCYGTMLATPKWERADLMLAFTAARSSLLFMLKDPAKVKAEDRARVDALGASLELGLWYQSLSLALSSVQSEDMARAFREVYMMDDVIAYFDTRLGRMAQALPKQQAFLADLAKVNQASAGLLKVEQPALKDLDGLRALLAAVVN